MANADPSTLAVADEIAGTNDDGVAVVIEALLS
jgi:hypothetical protein